VTRLPTDKSAASVAYRQR